VSPALRTLELPSPAPAGVRVQVRVLALGAFLKNTACLLHGRTAQMTAVHGDLGEPDACAALEQAVAALLASCGGRIDAVAHDLHPDFFSTRLALRIAAELGVPAIAVQHHHAHLAVLQAQHGWRAEVPLVGLALDGVGLGTDDTAWGGEVLVLRDGCFERFDHLPLLALPGGDVAAREPWRLAAAALHQLRRGDEIATRLGPVVGHAAARVVQAMLARDLNCPRSSGAGRWFDAMAGALGLSVRQTHEAQAAVALEAAATAWLETNQSLEVFMPTLDLWPLLALAFDTPRTPDATGAAAANFHVQLAAGLVASACRAAAQCGADTVALGGGCFYNRLLTARVVAGLQAHGLRVLQTRELSCGDAGLSLGQAWAAALQLAQGCVPRHLLELSET
jgi:hydrogenase maturation protein HypF